MKAFALILPLGLGLAALQPTGRPATDYVDLGHPWLVLAKVPAGTFQMGTDLLLKDDQGWDNDVEHPVHQVTISRDFWMGKCPVTQGQWLEVIGNNPLANAGYPLPWRRDWSTVADPLAACKI